MEVKELIEKLSKMPSDSNVWLEGCDCENEATDVELENTGAVIIKIKR